MAVVKNLMVRAGADFSAITKQSQKASDSMNRMAKNINSAASRIKSAFSAIGAGLSVAAIVSAAKDAVAAYDSQVEAQARLAQVMRNTMGARVEEIQSIEDLCSAQEKLGVIEGDVQLAGAQELATYLTQKSSLEKLIPVMNDMVAQQYGFNATQESATNIATMLGKVMEGQTGALSRYGYYFDDAQQKILKYGTEAQRAAVLAEIVESSVGGMNQALAKTPTGRMKQLSMTLGEVKENFGKAVRTLGTAFLPVLNTVAKILADVATLANKVAQAIANVFGGKSNNNTYTYAAPQAADAVEGVADSYNDVAQNAQKAAKAQKAALSVLDIDTLHFLSKKSNESSAGDDDIDEEPYPSGGNPMGGITESAGEATESAGLLENILQKLKDLWNELDFGPLKKAWEGLKEALDPLIDKIKNGLGWCWENVLKPLAHWTIEKAAPAAVDLLSAAFNALNAVLEALKPAFTWLWENVLKPLAQWTGELFIFAMQEITDLLNKFADLINGKISFRQFLADLDAFQKSLIAVGVALAGIKIASWVTGGIAAIEKLIAKVVLFKETLAGAATATSAASASATAAGQAAAAAGGTAAAAAGKATTAIEGAAVATETAAAASMTLGQASAIGSAAVVVMGNEFKKILNPINDYNKVIYDSSASSEELKAVVDELTAAYEKERKVQEDMTWWQRLLSNEDQKVFDIHEKLIDASYSYEAALKREGKATQDVTSNTRTLGTQFADTGNKGSQAAQTISSKWHALGDTMKQAGTTASNGFASGLQTVIAKAQSIASSVKDILSNISSDIGSALSSIGSGISSTFSSFTSSISSGFSSFKSSASNLLGSINIPFLANGAVIPPNTEFAAILGDQRHGYNIETPEDLLRQIFREETSAGNDEMISIAKDILRAVKAGKIIAVDGTELGRTARSALADQSRAFG